MKKELSPCPFCGGAAEVKKFDGMFSHGWVGCPKCKVYMNWSRDPAGAVKKWNRRTVIKTAVFDLEELHHNCTVQVLTNSGTGETSVGWWREGEEP